MRRKNSIPLVVLFGFLLALVSCGGSEGSTGSQATIAADLEYPAELKDVIPYLVIDGSLFKSTVFTDSAKVSGPAKASFSNTDRTQLTMVFQDVSEGDYYLQLLFKSVAPFSSNNTKAAQIIKSVEQEKCEQDLWETAKPYCESQPIEELCKKSISDECNQSQMSESQDGEQNNEAQMTQPFIIHDNSALGEDVVAGLVAKVSFREEGKRAHISFPATDFDLSFDTDENGQTNLSEILASLNSTQSPSLLVQQSWSRHEMGFNFDPNDVAYGEDAFVAVDWNGKIAFSHDGVSWSKANAGIGDTLYGVAFGNGIFVVVGFMRILYSDNGSQWNVASANMRFFVDVLFANDTFYALDYQGRVYRSADGSNWDQENYNVDETIKHPNMFNAIAFGNNIFVAVRNGGIIVKAGQDFNWMEVPSPTTENLNSVSFLNGSFFAVGNGGAILTSPDGSNWTTLSTGIGLREYLQDIAFGDGKYVVVAYVKAFVSADGSNWQEFNFAGGFGIASLAFGQDKFVAVGSAQAWTSP